MNSTVNAKASFNPQNPYRKSRPISSKIIYVACEGSVTEEVYFEIVKDCYSEISSKIFIVSVAEDAFYTRREFRTAEQNKMLSEGKPWKLLERIHRFKEEREEDFEFSQYPDDEFWIISDVDDNWADVVTDPVKGKTNYERWAECVSVCQNEDIHYAVSNPFFEVWLLMHHADISQEDESYAVTESHAYEKTNHFFNRLREVGAPMKEKRISRMHYNDFKIREAVRRADAIHIDKSDLEPRYLCSTVYLLIQEILDLIPKSDEESG